MTKEDLKYEAEQYSYDVPIYQIEQQLETIQKAYLAAAEPREKRIKELEESLLDIAKQSAKQIDELKKENTELKGKNKWYSEQVCNKECAEFGYNKAKEWHYVSKEGHPNKDDIYLTIRKDGLHLGDYCCGGDGELDCQSWCDYPSEEEIQDDSVIAWKEIELPELPKESE